MIDVKPLMEELGKAPAVFDWLDEANYALAYCGAKLLPLGTPLKNHHLILAAAFSAPVRMRIIQKLGSGSVNHFDQVISEVRDIFEADQLRSKAEREVFRELGI